MTPLYRNIAIAAALVALPAAATAAAGPERIRALPGRIGVRVRDWWEDDDVEGNLRRLATRLEDLTDRFESLGRERTGRGSMLGRVLALLGVAVLVPAALAAFVTPERARRVRDRAETWGAGDGHEEDGLDPDAELRRLSERLESLTGDLERQRASNFDAVTGTAAGKDA